MLPRRVTFRSSAALNPNFTGTEGEPWQGPPDLRPGETLGKDFIQHSGNNGGEVPPGSVRSAASASPDRLQWENVKKQVRPPASKPVTAACPCQRKTSQVEVRCLSKHMICDTWS
eukprot:1607864-Rhodomonas_salina.1